MTRFRDELARRLFTEGQPFNHADSGDHWYGVYMRQQVKDLTNSEMECAVVVEEHRQEIWSTPFDTDMAAVKEYRHRLFWEPIAEVVIIQTHHGEEEHLEGGYWTRYTKTSYWWAITHHTSLNIPWCYWQGIPQDCESCEDWDDQFLGLQMVCAREADLITSDMVHTVVDPLVNCKYPHMVKHGVLTVDRTGHEPTSPCTRCYPLAKLTINPALRSHNTIGGG